jgi:hypothetical protein
VFGGGADRAGFAECNELDAEAVRAPARLAARACWENSVMRYWAFVGLLLLLGAPLAVGIALGWFAGWFAAIVADHVWAERQREPEHQAEPS